MFKGLKFGQAWIEAWTGVLGAGDPDTLLRHHVGVKGTVYRRWSERWKREGRNLDPGPFLFAHLDEIRQDAQNSRGCTECGTENGLHASYCSFADTSAADHRFVKQVLDNDRPSGILYCRLGFFPEFKSDLDELLGQAIDSAQDEEQRTRYANTVIEASALRGEMASLLEEKPELVPKYRGDPLRALGILSAMLVNLVAQRAGAFARIGKDNDARWPLINDRLQNLQFLSDSEREIMEPVCAYIRQTSMFPGGFQEILLMKD